MSKKRILGFILLVLFIIVGIWLMIKISSIIIVLKTFGIVSLLFGVIALILCLLCDE